MTKVGIIANPASGKDIRRLVAHASVFDNNEKVNIVRRTLLGLDSVGVEEALIMPDYFGIGWKALDGLGGYGKQCIKATILDIPMSGEQDDSTRAAREMVEAKVGCIVTIGGDGTNRVVAKGCGDTPVLPVSTGTNNVIPYMIEGTVAGVAAGIVATRTVSRERATIPTKRLSIIKDGKDTDIALVDAVVSVDLFVGARALWDISRVKEVVVARGEPDNIGMSSIVGSFHPIGVRDQIGMWLALGEGGFSVRATISPGLICEIPVKRYELIKVGDRVPIADEACTIALDGEREISVRKGDRLSVELRRDGPLLVDIKRTLAEAVKSGSFRAPH